MKDNDRVHSRPVCILVVEDCPAHARLTLEALQDREILSVVHVATDGEQALHDLRGFQCTPLGLPDAVILDWNLPRIDGREVLRTIKADTGTRHIPVAVVSSSSNPDDIAEAHRLGASCYIVKPLDVDVYFDAIRQLRQLWFRVAALPRQSGPASHVVLPTSVQKEPAEAVPM